MVSGFRSVCKSCEKEQSKKYIHAPAKRGEYSSLFKTDRKEYDRLCNRDHKLKLHYNIGITDYNKLFETQEGKCAICGKHQSECKRKLAVDHDHETNKVRGLLCLTCNSGMGKLKDSEELLLKAVEYLRKHKEN